VAVPLWLQLHAALSEVMCFVCIGSGSLRFASEEFLRAAFSFWKSKIRDVKNCFFRYFAALDALVSFWEAPASLSSFSAHEYSVKK
jgi:hypothetical protein